MKYKRSKKALFLFGMFNPPKARRGTLATRSISNILDVLFKIKKLREIIIWIDFLIYSVTQGKGKTTLFVPTLRNAVSVFSYIQLSTKRGMLIIIKNVTSREMDINLTKIMCLSSSTPSNM